MSSPLEFGNPPRCGPPGYRLQRLHAFMPSCLHAFMPSTRFYMPCMDFTKSGRRSPLICFAVRLNFIFYYYNFAVRLSQGKHAFPQHYYTIGSSPSVIPVYNILPSTRTFFHKWTGIITASHPDSRPPLLYTTFSRPLAPFFTNGRESLPLHTQIPVHDFSNNSSTPQTLLSS